MQGKWAFDAALHWMPKRRQYRFRFMRYWGNIIYCWYYYFPPWFSIELHKPKKSLPRILKVFAILALVEAGIIIENLRKLRL